VKRLIRSKILFIKDLISKDYQDKHIAMIAQVNRSYVNKLRNGVLRSDVKIKEGEFYTVDLMDVVRQKTLDRIVAVPELMISGTTEQDMIYIHVLKFFGISKDEVYNLYFHLSKRQLGNLWAKADVKIVDFDSRLIGIPIREYLDLIIDFFL